MQNCQVNPSKIFGEIRVPPSKSHTLRAILFASLAKGRSQIRGYLKSPDTEAMLKACCALGAEIPTRDEEVIEIIGVAGKPALPDDVINAGNSGQVLRFIAAIASMAEGTTVLTGDASIRYNRPIHPLMEGLRGLGGECISTKGDGYAPLVVKGPIAAGSTCLKGGDSQPVSALLIASAFLKGKTAIEVNDPGEKPWVGLTLGWLDKLGVPYTNENFSRFTVEGGKEITAFNYTVPGDFSAAAYPLAAALITQSPLRITGLDFEDSQGDKAIIPLLQKMGANIEIEPDGMTVLSSPELEGLDIDVNDFIDAVPILAVIACFAKGKTRLGNAAMARKKESDRLSAITQQLTAMGASIVEEEACLTILPRALKGASLLSFQDHRIAMALMVAALAAEGDSKIQNIDCIQKSYPHFIKEMQAIGASVQLLS